MRSPHGAFLLVLVLLVGYAFEYGREVFRQGEPPAFFVETRPGTEVMLGEGFPQPGLHQFYDGITPLGVIMLTKLECAANLPAEERLRHPLASGEFLDIRCSGKQVVGFERSWLPAVQRMALGLPLHPDSMGRGDWQALPGIGPALAQRIEEERQRSGEFGSLEGLRRVPGIGPRRIEAWKEFFSDPARGL